MSLIHDKLHYHSSLNGVMFKEYVEDLVKIIFNTYKYNNDNIELELKIDNIYTDINLVASIGLIINELISNSYKYAFPDNRKGKIYLRIYKLNENTFEVLIGDDGVGLPKEFNFKDANTLGLQVVGSVVAQHNGKLEIINDKGTEYKITFDQEEQVY